MYEQGYITEAAVPGRHPPGAARARPTSSRRRLDSKAPYFTSWMRQQLVDRYGAAKAFFGGLKVKTTLDLRLQAAAEEAVNSYLGYSAADRLGRRPRQPQRRRQGDGRRPQLRNQAVQPGDARAPPAGLLDQAVHAGHRARRGDLALHGLRIGAADLPLRQARQGNLRRPQRRGLLPRLLRHRLRDDLLRQLDLRAARARRAEGQDDPRPHLLDRRDDPQDGLPGADLDQPGDGARRPQGRRDAARMDLRLHDPRQRRRPRQRHAGARTRRQPGRLHRRSPTRTATRSRAATTTRPTNR